LKSLNFPDQTVSMTRSCSFRSRLASVFFFVAMGGASVAGATTPAGPELTVSGLETDALIAPLGIADLTPTLSWMDTANVNGAVQTGYEIKAAVSASNLASGPLLWDSGQVQSSAQNARYGGTALASRSSVTWQVRVWDGTGAVSAWSTPTGSPVRVGPIRPRFQRCRFWPSNS
jgi:alpha-L-rhamnosidase